MKGPNKYLSLYSLVGILSPLKMVNGSDCEFIDGNYYCQETDVIVYSNVGIKSFYMDVTSMNEDTCVCQQSKFEFSGSLAPLDEELSVHFRGPIELKQFGVYYPVSNKLNKRDTENSECDNVVTSQLQHKHKREIALKYIDVTETITVDEYGSILSTDYGTFKEAVSTSSIQDKSGSSSNNNNNDVSNGDWERVAYYEPGHAENCVFMNNMGGTAGSGVWSSCFGNSISFAASNGIDGSSSPVALGDVLVSSDHEFMIFSGEKCNGYSDCGYYRDGIPAYKGFAGSEKIFVFEFQMPSDLNGDGIQQDMPAIWLLNAKIPRTLEYGKAECSCWKTGCGELDLFEILSKGSDKMISHIHDAQDGGTQNYFVRPLKNTMKAAVVFDGDNKTIHILKVDDDFDEILSKDTVSSWLEKKGTKAVLPNA